MNNAAGVARPEEPAVPSPFPGMDPFLEGAELWPAFHHNLVFSIYMHLMPSLVDRYRARVKDRRYVPRPGCAEQTEEFIEIRLRDDDRQISVIEAVSPANKATESGRRAYLEHRRIAREAGANIVEIDLVLRGQPMLEYSREGLPDWDYAVTVTRSTQPERYEIYTGTLEKRLPRFRLPLAADDRDTVVELNQVFNRCYDQGAFAGMINYRREPTATLSEAQRRWVDEHLQLQKLRLPLPPQENIALAAYYLSLREGCPLGREMEHWTHAIDQLRDSDT
jgi:hypothetical protein